MCGICGDIGLDRSYEPTPELIEAMLDVIEHRGPDGLGVHVSRSACIGHRRLSIIDLATGQQPLSNEDGTVWITFNGEIYNYEELRDDLIRRGHNFRTKSDTETIVHLYEEYGERCVDYLRGMFAFAIWDEREQTAFIARDRLGIKPLYYTQTRKSLLFASEVKALLTSPEVTPSVDARAMDAFLTHYYAAGVGTLFQGIKKLPPGHYLRVRGGRSEVKQYWDLRFERSDISFADAVEQLEALLEESVRLHMIADVPVGFLLSGGLDSTAMLSMASRKTNRAISSFTIGFGGGGVPDERPFARIAANAVGSAHYEMSISADAFVDFLPKYVWHMEEPVCEPPAVALYYISRLAAEHVKVLISGEGGDEAFAGYPNYLSLSWLDRLATMVGPARPLFSRILSACRILGSPGRKLATFAPLAELPMDQYYFSRTSTPFQIFNAQYRDLYQPEILGQIVKQESTEASTSFFRTAPTGDPVNRMLYVDSKTWLPDDLLIKADKMTMANSVELRVPMLDHKVMEFAASVPGNYKVRGLKTKAIAKQALAKSVPEQILKRKKAGFPVPYNSWLRHELGGWLKDTLLDRGAATRQYFRPQMIEQLIERNQPDGRFSKELFSLVVLELWHKVFLAAPPTRTFVGGYKKGARPLAK